MDVMQSGKDNIEKVSLFLKWGLPMMFILLIVSYLIRLTWYVWFTVDITSVFSSQPLLMIGLPTAGIAALALVLSLEQSSEKIKFKGLSFELEGVAGQLILWVICFLSIVGAIKVLAAV